MFGDVTGIKALKTRRRSEVYARGELTKLHCWEGKPSEFLTSDLRCQAGNQADGRQVGNTMTKSTGLGLLEGFYGGFLTANHPAASANRNVTINIPCEKPEEWPPRSPQRPKHSSKATDRLISSKAFIASDGVRAFIDDVVK